MAYKELFKSGRIGGVRIKNRTVMPAMGVSLASPTGEANEHIIKYYEDRAKGGVGLIITEITRVDEVEGIGTPNQLGATESKHVPHLERLAERVHKYGTKILVQLQHPGRENKSSIIGGRQIVAPSAVMCKVTKEMPRAMTTEECSALVKNFIKGAVIAQKAGMDGVELHAAHGYLLNEFLSPYTNKRTDRYGGSFDNRIRILEEIITGIRFMCGPKFLISVRLSADEFVEGGLKIEDTVKIARTLESFGINVLNISSGIYETATTIIEPSSYPQGWKKHLAAEVKKNVKIPVIATNNIKDPEVAEQLLEEGVCDYIGLGRAHLADPEWANKAKEDRGKEINKCIGCLYCFTSLSDGGHIKCAVNPKCGREVDYANIERTGDGRSVAVIGGGPAGMVAALTLCERGFKPVIFEKAASLGGQLNIATKPIMKEKLQAYLDSLIYRIEKNGIEVKLNTEATVEAVKAIDPYAVFLATGGTPIIPSLPGVDGANVITAEEYLMGKKDVTGDVVVIGGGVTGMETAETIATKGGNKVTLVEMMGDIGKGLYRSVIADFTMRFEKLGIDVLTRQQFMSADKEGVVVMNTVNRQLTKISAGTVVLALGVRSNDISEKFEENFDNVIVLGDANAPGRIAEATTDGLGRASTL